jgi:putative tryptophan/tyrosine transport system substrate-binding protein
MKRREFTTGLFCLPVAVPMKLRAQQQAPRTIGLLSGGSAEAFGPLAVAFRAGLEAEGFVDGINLLLEARWANGHFDRLPSLAGALVNNNPSVIATVTTPAALAAKAATGQIPIVFVVGDDPIGAGLVTSMSRPGGNVTGLTNFASGIAIKRLELAAEALPNARGLAVLVNWDNPSGENEGREFRSAAAASGRSLSLVRARTDSAIEAAFATAVERRFDAVLVTFDPVFFTRREQIIELAAQHRVPTIYPLREFALAGGLMSYGASFLHLWRQAGVYVARLLNGEPPSDLPVQQATKYELVINLKTARALGLTISPSLLARADEVIE